MKIGHHSRRIENERNSMRDPSNAQNEAPNWSSEVERTGKSLKRKRRDMWGNCKYPLPPLRSKSGAEALELTGKTDRSAGGLNRRRRKGKGNRRSRRNDVALRNNVEGNNTVEAWLENIVFERNGIMRSKRYNPCYCFYTFLFIVFSQRWILGWWQKDVIFHTTC